MTLTLQADPLPLRVDPSGDIRVGQSNVLFEFVVEKFEEGMTPEALVEGYSTLNLADVYAAIAYYLQHREEVKAYLAERDKAADKLWKEIQESQPERPGFRQELLARQARKEKQNAAPAG